jgi:hypothetical protein
MERIQSPEINSYTYSCLIFDKGPKAIQILLGQLNIQPKIKQQQQHSSKTLKRRSYSLEKNNSKWIIYLNVKCKMLKLSYKKLKTQYLLAMTF